MVQAAVADGVLLAEPGEEALKTKTVTAVGRRTVPGVMLVRHKLMERVWWLTYFLWSVYQ